MVDIPYKHTYKHQFMYNHPWRSSPRGSFGGLLCQFQVYPARIYLGLVQGLLRVGLNWGFCRVDFGVVEFLLGVSALGYT